MATYTTVDLHTGGEPLRVVTAGVPRSVPGATMLEKRTWFARHCDHVRCALLAEPRGHADMYGAVLTEPVRADSHCGVLFLHNAGYSDMCGHGIIALATALVRLGMLPDVCGGGGGGGSRSGESVSVRFDTPAGLVVARVEWDGVRVGTVAFENVASFVLATQVAVETLSFGRVVADVAFGGAFYAYVDLPQPGLVRRCVMRV
jgi:proline racemase